MPKGVGNKGKVIARKKKMATPQQQQKKPKKYVAKVIPEPESKTPVRKTTQDYDLQTLPLQVFPPGPDFKNFQTLCTKKSPKKRNWYKGISKMTGLFPKILKILISLSCGKYC